MSDRITRWLDESQQLADKATEGPWEVYGYNVLAHLGPGNCNGCSGVLSPAHLPECGLYEVAGAGKLDAEFIAESRTRLPQAVAALRAVLDVLDRWAPPDPHESDEGCTDCELLHHAQQAIADALGLEGDGDEQ